MTPLVAYVPVVHRGYLELFRRYPHVLYVLDEGVLSLVPYLARDVRACNPQVIAQMVHGLGIFGKIGVADGMKLSSLSMKHEEIVMPDEDISRAVAERFFHQDQVRFEQVFLRWHYRNAASESRPDADRTVTGEEAHLHFIRIVDEESRKSPDWWRQIGACAVRGGKMIVEARHNEHFPAEQSAYIIGDPRTPFSAGERIDLSLAAHAERLIISDAARLGIVLDGADLYVTTFPCPGCAYAIATAGIRRVFYRDGYSLVDADKTLREHGVELIRVVGTA